MAIVLEADKDGFLTWNKYFRDTNVFCPFSPKMQCNVNCPMFSIAAKENNIFDVSFLCVGGGKCIYQDIKLTEKRAKEETGQ